LLEKASTIQGSLGSPQNSPSFVGVYKDWRPTRSPKPGCVGLTAKQPFEMISPGRAD